MSHEFGRKLERLAGVVDSVVGLIVAAIVAIIGIYVIIVLVQALFFNHVGG